MNDEIQIIPATISDYPIVQNLARFYVYDRSGFMGWGCEEDGNFECIDFKHYFTQPDHKSFIIKVNDELAGFVLLDKKQITDQKVDWNMGEFFIIAKFQGAGVAAKAVRQIFAEHKGQWSVAVMLENVKALKFWHRIISQITNGHFSEIKKLAQNEDEYAMIVCYFEVISPNL
jgi:predicted acetyltransferase